MRLLAGLFVLAALAASGCTGPDGHTDFGDVDDPDNLAVIAAILDDEDRRDGRFIDAAGFAFVVTVAGLALVPQRFFTLRRLEPA